MKSTISGKDLKKIGESLARFADVRETAKEPRDRVVVQANGETIKVVAGAYFGTMIATVHATTQQFRAVISAREFLTTVRSLSTRQDYQIVDLDRGFEIGCTLDGHDFLRLSNKLPVLLLPPDITSQSQGTINLTAEKLDEIGRLMPEVADEIIRYPVTVAGRIYTKNDKVRFVGCNNTRFAATEVKGNYDIFGQIEAEFLEAARGMGDSIMELWTDGKVTLDNDMYRAIGNYSMLKVGAYPLDFPAGSLKDFTHKTVIERNSVVKSVREQQKFDKQGRVALLYDGNALRVEAFDESKHGWYVRGENLTKVLAAISAKQVGIGFRTGRGQPINVRIPEWQIEVAPVELSTRKSDNTP